MKTITFFSYKGGVGRSMALLNTAWEMACLGKRVGIIDFDLEAPGLSLLPDFNPKKKRSSRRYGLTDLVEDRIEVMRGKITPPRLEDYGYLNANAPEFKKFGSIFMLPAGRVEFPISKNIAGPLSGIQNDFESELKLKCEYLFIDSRTGLTDITGITTIFLPDLVFVILGLNKQNIEGTLDVLERLKETKFADYAYLIPSLIPVGSDELVEAAYRELKERLTNFGLPQDRLLIDLALHYHPYLAVRDAPLIGKGVANILDVQYKAIAQKIIELNPDDPIKKISTARSLIENKDYQQALRLIGPVASRPEFSEDIEFLRLYGRICIETDNMITAQDILERALNIEQKCDKGKDETRTIKTALLYSEILKKRGKSLYIGFLEKARFFKGSDEERRTIYARLNDASLYDDYTDLFNYFKIIKEIAESDPVIAGESASGRAELLKLWGRTDEAINIFKDEINHFSKAAKGLGNLIVHFGKFLESNQQWEEAVKQYSKALEYSTKEEAISLHLLISAIYWDHIENSKDRAVTQLKKALETYEDDERLLWKLALYCYLREDIQSGIEYLKKRIEVAPWDRLFAIDSIATMSIKLGISSVGNYEALLKKDIQEKSKWYIHYINLGAFYLHHKRFQEAAEILETGARQCVSTEAREVIANVLDKFRENVEAIDFAIEVLKKPIFNKTSLSYFNLSSMFVRKRDWTKALEYAQKYMTVVPSTDLTLAITRVAKLLSRLEKTATALELLKKKSMEQKENIGLHQEMIRVLIHTGHYKEALKELDSLEKKTGKFYMSYILEMRVRLWTEHLGDPEQARKIIENTFEKNSDSHKLLFQIANCYDIIGDFDKAREIWRNFKYYGNEEFQMQSTFMLAQNLFGTACYEESIREVEYLEKKEFNKINILFLKLQCYEALGKPVETLLKELEDHYADKKAIDSDGYDLRNIIRISLRNKDRMKRAEEFAGWIDDSDISWESTNLRSCEALYYFCIGKSAEAMSLLERIMKLGYFNTWIPPFLHDLKILSKQYAIKPGYDEIVKMGWGQSRMSLS